MSTGRSYRAWCLSWDEEEAHGCDVVPYDILGEYPRGRRGVVHVPDTRLRDAADAAEAYARHAHDQRDGWDSSWPLVFRVRDPDGATCDFEVDREYVTEFRAAPVRAAAAGAPTVVVALGPLAPIDLPDGLFEEAVLVDGESEVHSPGRRRTLPSEEH